MFIDYGTHIQVLPFPSSLPAFTGANLHVRACEAVVVGVGVLEGRGTAEGAAGTGVGYGAVRAALCSGPMWTGSVGSAQKMAVFAGPPQVSFLPALIVCACHLQVGLLVISSWLSPVHLGPMRAFQSVHGFRSVNV